MQYNDGSPYMWVSEVRQLINNLSRVIKEGLENGKSFDKIEMIDTLDASIFSEKRIEFNVKFKEE